MFKSISICKRNSKGIVKLDFVTKCLVFRGSISTLGVSNDRFTSTWVIDSSSIDHMTFSSYHLSSYNLCFGDEKIKFADGIPATMAVQGKIALTLVLTLKSMLHVPKFSANLVNSSNY